MAEAFYARLTAKLTGGKLSRPPAPPKAKETLRQNRTKDYTENIYSDSV
jgi:hypothetical protein